MSLAGRYREFAAACVQMAHQAASPEDKALLLDMAETWRRLAERAGQAGNKRRG